MFYNIRVIRSSIRIETCKVKLKNIETDNDNHKNGIVFYIRNHFTREYSGYREKLKKLPGISNFPKKLYSKFKTQKYNANNFLKSSVDDYVIGQRRFWDPVKFSM